MPANEMLDVLHVLFEEDTLPKYPGELEAKSAMRKSIYRAWHGRTYLFGVDGDDDLYDLDAPYPYANDDNVVKPFIPPTPVEDLPDILGAPMGE